MAQSSYAYDNDSPLAIVSSIAGILTFLAALVLGLWIRVNNWQSAEREFEDFERYLKRHRTELGWMHDLLYTQNETRWDPPTNDSTGSMASRRPDANDDTVRVSTEQSISEARIKAAVASAEKNLLKSHRQHKKAPPYTTPRHRWYYIGSRVIQRNRLRKEAMEKLAERNARDRKIYHMILDHLAQLDQSLQSIVDDVRPPRALRPKPLKYAGYCTVLEKAKEHPLGRVWEDWRARYRVAWKWLALRERAWQLRSERDIQWNRVHASQLALIARRLEDQEFQLTRLEGRFAGFLGLRTHEA